MKSFASSLLSLRQTMLALLIVLGTSAVSATTATTLYFDPNATSGGFDTSNWSNLPSGIFTSAWTDNSVATFAGSGQTLTTGTANDTWFVGGFVFSGGNTTVGGSGVLSLASGASMSVDSGKSATISAKLAGTSGFTKSGAGKLIVTTGNTYSGVTTINGGVLSFTTVQAPGTSTMAINDGTWECAFTSPFNRAISLNHGNSTISTPNLGSGFASNSVISGTGTLNKIGPGKLTLVSATSNYSGGTKLTEGILAMTNSAALSTGSVIFNGGTLELSATSSLTVANNMSIPLGIVGTISVGSARQTVSGVISGAGSLSKSGATELVLSGSNTYLGGTTVAAGSLTLGINNALATSSTLSISSGATFKLGNFTQSIGMISGSGAIDLGTGSLSAGSSNVSFTFGGNMTGSGNFTKLGSGTMTLSGKMTHSGLTTVQSGTLGVSNSNSLSSAGDLAVSGSGTLQLNASQSILALTGSGNVSLGTNNLTIAPAADKAFSGVLSGSGGLVKDGAGNFTLSGNNTYTGSTSITSGALILFGGSLAGTVDVAGNATFAISGNRTIGSLSGAGNVALGGSTLTLGGDDSNTTFSGEFTGTSAAVVKKAGTGTFTLDKSASVYPGGITVEGGLLAVNGTALSTAFKVPSGGTLGGTGTISSLDLQSGGTLSPGSFGAGKLTKQDDLVLVEGSTLAIDLNGTTVGTGYDQVEVQEGKVVLGNATLSLSLSYTPVAGDSFVLINKTNTGVVSGALKYGGSPVAEGGEIVVSGKTFALSYAGGDGNDVVLSYVVPQLKVASVAAPTNAYYKAGDALVFTVNVNSAATVTGTPRLALNIGGTTVYANYTATGSTSTALKFSYSLGGNDVDTDGIEVGALELNGGSIVDSSDSSKAAILTFTAPNTAGVKVDAYRPFVTTVGAPTISSPGGTSSTVTLDITELGSGIDTASIKVTNIAVTKGATSLVVSDAQYASGRATYTIAPPGGTWDGADDGTYTISIVSNEIKDVAGNFIDAVASAKTFSVALGLEVASISPASGPTAGGTTVTLTGKGFTGVTGVKFGTTAAASYSFTSDTSMTAVSPAGSAGAVNITVTTGVGTSPTTAGNAFTYIAPPVIGTGPQSQSVAGLGSATFSVTATGTAPLSYQWYFKGSPMDGQNFPTLNLPLVLATHTGDYKVKVTNGGGSVESDPATLNVKPYVLNLSPDRMVGLGGKHRFFVDADGSGTLSYQWKRNGNPVDGATNSRYEIAAITLDDTGSYTVELSQTSSSDKTTSNPSVLTGLPNPISAMAQTGIVDNKPVVGYFSIEGTASKKLVIAAYGPAVSGSLTGAIADVMIEVESATGAAVTQNDNWGDITDPTFSSTYARLGLTPLTTGSKDAVIYRTFTAGSYRVRVSPVGNVNGKFILTIADGDLNPQSRLSYVAVRGPLQSGSPLTGGFTMVNSAQKKMLLRAIGPSLGSSGHANPAMKVIDSDKTTVLLQNDDWAGGSTLTNAFTQAGAFSVAADSKDAAVVGETRVGTGSYTAEVSATSGTGDVLWEVFDLVGTTPTTVAPIVILPPVAQSVTGGNVTFSVTANGGATLGYVWKKGSDVVPGATNSSLALTGVTDATAGVYTVEVSNTSGLASANAQLKVTPKINSTLIASGTYGTAIDTYTIAATNHPTSFTATGLPPGLSVETTTGKITGTPTDVSGSPYNVTIGASNSDGSDSATLVFTINKAALTIASVTSPGKVYDATLSAPLNTSSAALSGLVNGDIAGTTVTLDKSSATGAFASVDVGGGKAVAISGFKITGSSAGNYTLTQPSTTAAVTKKPLTVAGLAGAGRTYDGTDIAPLSGTAALLTVEAPGTGATDDGRPYSGDAVSLTGAAAGKFADRHVGSGPKAITVSNLAIEGAQSGNYDLVQPTGLTATLTPKTLTVTGLSGVNRTYDATDTAGLSGTAVLLAASAPGGGSTSDGKPYTGDAITLGGSITAKFASKDVGSHAITVTGYQVTGDQAGNYLIAQPTALSATIGKKTLTVIGLTALNRTYDGTTAAPLGGSATLPGAESPGSGTALDGKPYAGDDVTVSGTAIGAFANRFVADAKPITVTGSALSGAQKDNYDIAQQVGLTANVTVKTLFVTGVTGTDRTYDATKVASLAGTAKLLTAIAAGSGASSDGKPYDVDSVTVGGTITATFDSKDVGSRAITVDGYALSGDHKANYTVVQPTGLTATISAKALTVIGVAGVTRVYNATDVATLSGTAKLLDAGAPGSGTTSDGKPYTGDTITLGGTTVVKFNNKTVGTSKPITVTGYAVTGAQAANYTVTQPAGLTADVTAKNLTVSGATANNKVYDGNTTATPVLGSAVLVGVIDGDTVSLVKGAATATFADASAAPGKPVQFAGLSLAGADAPNYSLTQPATTASISPAPVQIAIANLSHTYDGTPKAATITITPSAASAIVYSNAGGSAPTNAGTYLVSVAVTDNNYSGSANATLTIAKAAQTVNFSLTGTNFNLGSSLGLSATATSGGPVSFSIVSGSAMISGSSVSITTAGPVTVRASQAGTENYLPASADRTFTGINNLTPQTISFTVGDHARNEAPFKLTATATSGLPVSFAVVSGPAILNGDTLTLTGVTGTVTIRASQAGNTTFAAAPDVVRSFTVVEPGPNTGIDTYFGDLVEDPTLSAGEPGRGEQILGGERSVAAKAGDIATVIDGATRTGNILIVAPSIGLNVALDFRLQPDGTYSIAFNGAARALTMTGSLAGGILTGRIPALKVSFSTPVQVRAGPTVNYVGFYESNPLNTAQGTAYSVVGPNGQALVLVTTPTITAGTTTTVRSDGTFTAQASNVTITGSVDAPTTTVSGSILIDGQAPINYSGLAVTTARTDRLINLSSRVRVGPAAGRTLITGFVIGGGSPKRVLLRAVGPALTGFGVSGALSNPRLQLYDGSGKLILENDDWSGADTATATTQVGAFSLVAGSRDAAVLTALAPGSYTMHVIDGGETGVALAEIYDASGNPNGEYQRLINISTRGEAGSGENLLIGGFIVTGNSPKKVLVRGVGPGLAAFGLTGTLADPRLRVYGASGLIAENDNWSTVAADATGIAAAATETGAFALASGSKDAAILLTLAPGAYTAQVGAADGTSTGVALVEIYEVPQ